MSDKLTDIGYTDIRKISRVEVIGSSGREYVRYFKDEEFMRYEIQDQGRTLKIFIDEEDYD